jgi:small-conductance mechanosensitive channel
MGIRRQPKLDDGRNRNALNDSSVVPFIEEKKWPFSSWFSEANDIAQAIKPLQERLDAANSELSKARNVPPRSLPSDIDTINELRSNLADAKRQLEARQSPQPAQPSVQNVPSVNNENVGNNDLLSQLDILRSIDSQFNNISRTISDDYRFYGDWSSRIKANKEQYALDVTNSMYAWDRIMRAFLDMPVSDAYRTEIIDAAGAQARRQQTYLALVRLSEAVTALPAQLPDDYENIIRPYVNALKNELDTDRAWMEKTQKMSVSKRTELSNILCK